MCFLFQEPAPAAPAFAANKAEAEEDQTPAQAIHSAQDMDSPLEDHTRELSVSVGNAVMHYEFNERYHMLMHVKEWL